MGGLNNPKGVWSPAGGFFPDPKHWKRNTALAFMAIIGISIPVFIKSVEIEQRPTPPHRWIPSQMWSKNIAPPPAE